MRKIIWTCVAAATLMAGASEWRELFNGRDLTGWYTYLKGRGKNVDPAHVFTVTNGVIHVTGTEWGALVTDESFANYRLLVEYRWLGTRCKQKTNAAFDSGILFHSTGPDGGFGDCWLFSHEYNLIYGASGDIWTVGNVKKFPEMFVKGEAAKVRHGGRFYIWQEGGESVTLVGNNRLCRFDIAPDWTDTPAAQAACNENPLGEWNTAELICAGDKVTCLFNGKVVNKATKVYPAKGKLQLQSEGCGVEFRRVAIKSLP